METIKNFITRLGLTGGLILIGFILIIYIAIGFLYFQQGAKQKQLDEQIAKLSIVVSRPLSSDEELQAAYDNVTSKLSPLTDGEAISILVNLAEQSGIDINEGSGKFQVPPARYSQAKIGAGTYQVISFKNVVVQGDYDDVMAFVSDLDSGTTRENMVLQKVAIKQQTVQLSAEEIARRSEFNNVAAAVETMMMANRLPVIPNPMSVAEGFATNLMGDDPNTEGMVEGFPDITTTAAEKDYTGTGTPRDGYVLYNHDKILTDNFDQFETVSYFPTLTTNYYYTCEADGTVRQWDSPNVATAEEYLDRDESTTKIELKATMDIDIYVKP